MQLGQYILMAFMLCIEKNNKQQLSAWTSLKVFSSQNVRSKDLVMYQVKDINVSWSNTSNTRAHLPAECPTTNLLNHNLHVPEYLVCPR